MYAQMASGIGNTEQPVASGNWRGDAVSVVVQLHPELLMAAKRGDWRKLEDLMSKEAASVPEFVVDVDVEGAGERCRRSESPLHVVASGGDGEEFLISATVIFGKAKHLLCARNAIGDTPLHCAARAGSVKMVSHLIGLASHDGVGGASGVKLALRKENERGETALHEAVRWGDEEMVRVLMSADAELARFPRANGASPLYLAVLLEHDEIAEQLYREDNQLSYSGPDGQNALHAAVIRSKKMTKKLLEWNNGNLIKQGDLSSGSTPLHVAASWRSESSLFENLLGRGSIASATAKLLLDAHELLAYQPDGMGSFPIHAAASANNVAVARVLLRKCPDCIHLRDAQGRTFLHIAAFKGYTFTVQWLFYTLFPGNGDCRVQRFVNLQDSEGNTALHLAAMAGQLWIIRRMISRVEVRLDLQNDKGQTALDLAESRRPRLALSVVLDPTIRMRRLLVLAGGRPGVHRRGQEQADRTQSGEKREEERIKDTITTIGVVSVLIITVSFASAFQLPGGYSTGDSNEPAGTPELAMKYSFQAFVLANNLAASCSAMATICLMYAGITAVDVATRGRAIEISVFLVNSASRSLAAAYAFGTYAVLAPVAHAAVVITWVLTGLVMLDIAWLACTIAAEQLVLLNRFRLGMSGFTARLQFACLSVSVPFWVLWPYVVIAGFMVYLKVHGIR